MHNEDELIFVKTPARNRANKFTFTDDQIKAYNGLIKFINEPYNPNDFKRALIGRGGSGKALANNTPVLTNNGWKNVKELNIGDVMLSDAGQLVIENVDIVDNTVKIFVK